MFTCLPVHIYSPLPPKFTFNIFFSNYYRPCHPGTRVFHNRIWCRFLSLSFVGSTTNTEKRCITITTNLVVLEHRFSEMNKYISGILMALPARLFKLERVNGNSKRWNVYHFAFVSYFVYFFFFAVVQNYAKIKEEYRRKKHMATMKRERKEFKVFQAHLFIPNFCFYSL